ncbi:MAG TPA: hypothetical protein VKE51_23870 [Vicinamibacterales bacterium]|nr:hypothetical protein [Vicinamibacterales bacterium]
MELIAAPTRIDAKRAAVLTALTTTDGVRNWWTDDADVGCDIGAPAICRCGTIEVTFLRHAPPMPEFRCAYTLILTIY